MGKTDGALMAYLEDYAESRPDVCIVDIVYNRLTENVRSGEDILWACRQILHNSHSRMSDPDRARERLIRLASVVSLLKIYDLLD